MESIEDSDKDKWIDYRNSASILVNGRCCGFSFGGLTEIGSRVNDEIALKEFLATRTHPQYWTTTNSRFEWLCNKLQERNITTNSLKARELSAIPHASDGMNVDEQTHIVYVSKLPIRGRVDLVAKSSGFSGYVDQYGDLIMSVGATISEIVENRGIFRNPLSIVEGGYANVAMMTHCFTCMAIEDNWPEVTTFKVRPLKKMGEIFVNSLPKDKVTINGIPGNLYDGGFEYEQNIQVPVAVLADLYRFKKN